MLFRSIVPVLAVTGLAITQVSTQEACRLEAIGMAKVAAVRDGRTLVLDDGREAQLAAIEVPLPYGVEAAAQTAAQTARAALENLAIGHNVMLKRLGTAEDRYGRIMVHAFLAEDGAERSLQQSMLAGGHARVAARIGDRACAAELLAAERVARAAKLGLWAEPAYGPRQAEEAAALLDQRGRFTVVEGKVLSVREAGSTIYLNFGRRWSRDFTVTILKRNARIFTAAGIEPKQLEGRRIRVRGWIERRGNPIVEAARPEQIELAERN